MHGLTTVKATIKLIIKTHCKPCLKTSRKAGVQTVYSVSHRASHQASCRVSHRASDQTSPQAGNGVGNGAVAQLAIEIMTLSHRSPKFSLPLWAVWRAVLMLAPIAPLLFTATVTAQAVTEPTRADQGMVVSAHPLASDAGLAILQKGGNAIDAAVATTLAISVVEPFSAGIGGGGFLLYHQASQDTIRALDFRERAPIAATATMYLDANGEPTRDPVSGERLYDSVNGHRAAAVPGTIAGLYEAHQQYGQLPWAEVVQPAIDLARSGFPVSERLVQVIAWRSSTLLNNPAARSIFLQPDDRPYGVGDRLIQADLAATLERIAQNPQDFYTGETAAAIVTDMAANGGLITAADLATYQPIWREPICGTFRVYQVCSMPPPASGGVHLLQILNLIGETDLAGLPRGQALHYLVEAMKIAYADRAEYLGDPDFVDVPTAQLISPMYAAARRSEIRLDRARPAAEIPPGDPQLFQRLRAESNDTSHLSVVDADRNAVSLTFTINGGFGAGVVAAGTGIVLNNEMDDFSIAPGVPNLYGLVGGAANAIAPRKTPLSSMTPTIVTDARSGDLRLVVGAPGGSTIITTVLQIILNTLVFEMNVSEAIAAPRLHHQWQPDTLRLEANFDPSLAAELAAIGHPITQRGQWGNGNVIQVIPDPLTNPLMTGQVNQTGHTTLEPSNPRSRQRLAGRSTRRSTGQSMGQSTLEGAADPRGEGAARGY